AVGPSPPENTSRSLRAREVATSSFRRAALSPTTCWCSTVMPSSASSRLKNRALVLTMSPSKSSVPTQMISAVMGISPPWKNSSKGRQPARRSHFRVVANMDGDLFHIGGGFPLQRSQAGHSGLGGLDLGQGGPGLGVGRGEDGTAVLVRLDGGLKGADLAGSGDDLGLVHADQRAQHRQVLGGVG